MRFLQSVKKTSVLRENLFAQDCHRTGLDNSCRMYVDARKPVCDVDLVSKVKNDENQFLVLDNGTGTGCRI